ncbi:hypothetical protein FA15DRAFT_551067, partial [Coprinopsis marcescibilis]
ADLEQLRSDIASMVTPSWTLNLPSNLGEASHGKLKSDQWRMLGTTYLPASLIRLIATAHSTSKAKADLYLQLLQTYIDGVKLLFPDYRFKPNHHMAFHIAEYLCMYGPVHSWWTFPFERMIGLLQRIPTNNKYSKYEETIAKSFNRASNLRGMFYKASCPPAIK